MQTACHYKENPPVPIWRQKPCECIGKVPYLELTLRLALRQGKTYILSSIRRGCPCRGLFACPCFTNVSARCNAMKVPVLSALLYIRFLAPFLSFVYHLMYIAPFSLSIAKDHRGVSSTSFKYSFQLAAESCMYVTGVSFVPSTPKLGPYSPPTVGRQEPLKPGLYGPPTVER